MDSSSENVRLINSAWEKKQYDQVLSFLKKDFPFPENFNTEELSEEDVNQNNLKKFTEERNLLHEWIIKDEFEKVKSYTSKNKSKYFYNDENESAVFTALGYKKFKIYVHLQSIDVNFAEDESFDVDNLSDEDKQGLLHIMLPYFSRSKKSHIYFIISKIKINSENSFEKCEKNLIGYLQDLDKIPAVSTILKVIQYVDNLDLVLDLDRKDVKTVCPIASAQDKGITLHKVSSLYVAAGRKKDESLGTLAHEMAHMAMQLVFKNDCNPYFKSDKTGQAEFEEITEILRQKTEILRQKTENIPGTPWEIIHNVFRCYNENEQHRELIVRVPHILAQFKNGEEWLKINAVELLNFYNNKILPEFEKFIEESFLLKPKSLIRLLNESEGEINKIKKFGLFFTKIKEIENFLREKSKKIFALVTDYTWVGLLRALQGMYGDGYVDYYDRFLVMELENVVKKLDDVVYAFKSEAAKVLFVECPEILSKTRKTLKALEKIMEIVTENQDKKIIFIMKENPNEDFMEILEDFELENDFATQKDEDFSLCDLEYNSRWKILDSEIIFQGKKLILRNLINDNEDFLKDFNAGIIQDILNNKMIELGSKPFDMSYLEGAYADVVYEVNLETLIYEMKNNENMFIISGKGKSEFYDFLNQEINIVNEFKNFELEILDDKRIFLTSEDMTDDDFKIFCRFNSKKRIYFLKENNESKFILVKFYNPDFYFKRHLKRYKTIVFKKNILDNENNNYNDLEEKKNMFIIGQDGSKIRDVTSSNIKFLDFEKIDEEFEKLKQTALSVHVLKEIDNNLIWVKSFGSFDPLREWIDNEKSEKFVEDENELIKNMIKEKAMILSDDPGMGKSTTLTKLTEIESLLENHWVIRINLKDHIQEILKIDEVNVKKLIEFLTLIDPKLKNNLSKNLLKAGFDFNKKLNKILLLCFDGFDEILDNKGREKTMEIFKFLKNNTGCKIWVTTRRHLKENLENELLVWSINFNPIDDVSKIDFIENYMKDRLKLILTKEKFNETFKKYENESKSLIFTKEFTKKAKSIFKDDLKRFIGTPLQLLLLLENSIPSFRKYIEDSIEPDFSYLGSNLIDVYGKFFNRKFEIFCRKKKFFEGEFNLMQKDFYEKLHEKIAKALIFNKNLEEDVKKAKSSLLLLGLIKNENNKIEFVHFTFREYFFSKFIIKKLEKKDCSKHPGNLCEFFIGTILVERRYQLIRGFVDVLLENFETKESWKIYKETFCSITTSLTNLKYNGFNIAIEEKNNNVFDFLISLKWSASEYCKILTKNNEKPCFHVAVQWKNNFALDKIIKIASEYKFDKKLINKFDVFDWTPFQLTLSNKNDYALIKIFEIALNNNSDRELLNDGNDKRRTPLNIAIRYKNDVGVDKIIELAKKYQLDRQLLSNASDRKMTAFRTAIEYQNDYAFKKLIQLASEHNLFEEILNNFDDKKKTLFILAIEYKNDSALKKIIEVAENCKLDGEILSKVDYQKTSPFNWAIRSKNNTAVDLIIKIALKHNLVEEILINDVKGSERTPFHSAVLFKNNYAFEKIINIALNHNLLKELLKNVDKWKSTPFHTAVKEKNDHALNRIKEFALENNLELELLNNLNDEKMTPFHSAVKFKNDNALEKIFNVAFKYKLDLDFICNADNWKRSPFHDAVASKNDNALEKIIEIALEYDLDGDLLSSDDYYGKTPFHTAVEVKNDCALDRIIEIAFKYDLDLKLLNNLDRESKTPFHTAVQCNNDHALDRIIEIALKYNLDQELLNNIDKNKRYVFHSGITSKNNHALDEMIKIAVKHEFVEKLLTRGNYYNETALHIAVQCNNNYAFDRVIEMASIYELEKKILKGSNYIFTMTPFHMAVSVKNNYALSRIFDLAVKYDLIEEIYVKVNRKSKMTPFHTAVLVKNDFALDEIIKIAFEFKSDRELLSNVDFEGRTPFHTAVKEKNDYAIEKIIKMARDNNLELELLSNVDKEERTPFHTSIKIKNNFALDRIIEIALEHKAEKELLDNVDNIKNTPVFTAVAWENDHALNEIIKIASNHNSDLELLKIVDRFDMSLFHSAVRWFNYYALNEIIKIALKYNLDKELLSNVNVKNRTPFHTAVKFKNNKAFKKIIEIALKYKLDRELLDNIDIKNRTLFHTAIKSRNSLAINKIFKMGLKYNLTGEFLKNVDNEGMTLFHTAVKVKNDHGWDKIIELTSNYTSDELFEILSKVNDKNNNVLHLAIVDKRRSNLPARLFDFNGKKRISIVDAEPNCEKDYTCNCIFEMMGNFNTKQKYQILSCRNAAGQTVLDVANNFENDHAKGEIIKIINESGFSEEEREELLSISATN